MGFGDLKPLKEWLDHMFDHTLLIAEDDPELLLFESMHENGICDLRVLPDNSIEGCAKYIWNYTNELINKITEGRASCFEVEVRENDKNSATYHAD